MKRKAWQTLAVTSFLYFASAAPGYAEELPLPTSAEDVASTIQDIASTVAAVPEAPSLPTVVPTVPTPTADAPEPTPSTPQTATESQYQPPTTQYQPSNADATDTPAAPESTASDVIPATTQETTAVAPLEAPATTDISSENSTTSSLPSTWIWNWNWNCDPSSVPPEQNVIVDGTWSWNWNFNCTSPNAPSGSGQYQSASTQYQPQNSNISIRIGSPGDNGPVTQTIAAVAQATTATVNAIAQTAPQITDVGRCGPRDGLDGRRYGGDRRPGGRDGRVGGRGRSAPRSGGASAGRHGFDDAAAASDLGARRSRPAVGGSPPSGTRNTRRAWASPADAKRRAGTRDALAPRARALAAARVRRRGRERVGWTAGPRRRGSAARLNRHAAGARSAATGASTSHARAGRFVRRRSRRELGCRRRRSRPGGDARLLLLRSSVRCVAPALAERPSTSPAACVTARTPGLAHRLRLDALRAACPGATSKTV